MKTISSQLQAHINGELTTLAMLVKITRTDNVVKAFTTHDYDITIDSITYKADSAFTPSSIESRHNLAVDNLDVTGILDSDELCETDIKNGLYDFARIDVYVCNWAAPEQGVIYIRRGWLGQITRTDCNYTAEVRGLHDLLQRPIGQLYTPECRFNLGDEYCGKSLAALTTNGFVSAVTDNFSFINTNCTAASDIFACGKLTWLTGNNQGHSVEVKSYDKSSKTFYLWLPAPNAIKVGDAYSVTQGCDKRWATCQAVFANSHNFGGFPFVPGIGNILKYPV